MAVAYPREMKDDDNDNNDDDDDDGKPEIQYTVFVKSDSDIQDLGSSGQLSDQLSSISWSRKDNKDSDRRSEGEALDEDFIQKDE